MKILIIRFSSIGDIVLTTPVVRCLKLQLPDAEIHYLTKPAFSGIMESNPYVSRVHVLRKDWKGMLAELKSEDFDRIIDLHHNLRTLRLKLDMWKVKSRSFNKLNIQKWLLTCFKINCLPKVHIVDRYLATVKGLGVKNDGKGLDYFIPHQDEIKGRDIPTSHQAGYIGIAIGASYATKKLPLSKLKALCLAIQHPIILLGGKQDHAAGEELSALDSVRIYNGCGKFNLNESACLVRNAKCLICFDTGLMHIAAAFHKPIYSIWGNTVPDFGMTPYYGNQAAPSRIFEVKGLSCRPCSKIGYAHCPKKHFKCMQLQDMEAIAAACAPYWQQQ